ncbi:MAG: hypothetical protein IKP40_02830 [Clostridia bacterium]|nr:hypothetical protein [Clostridia bacterium]
MKTPLTAARIRGHLTYSWWKYALLAVACIMGWNLFYTVTAYRSPEDKKLTVYFYAYGDTAEVNTWLEAIRLEKYPDQEVFETVQTSPDDSSGLMVLSTHLFSGEGDLIVLPRDQFYNYARDSFFIELEEIPGLTEAFEKAGISIDKGWRLPTDPDTETLSDVRHFYGLPVASLPVLSGAVYATTEYFVGIRVASGNEDNAISLLLDICRTNPALAESLAEAETSSEI